MKSLVNKFIDILSNLKWDIIFYFRIFFIKDFRITIINNNNKLKNSYFGQRCFIVGNGPSLAKLDLSKITNETVFTVNYIMNNRTLYEKLNSDYHVLIDPTFLTLDSRIPEDLASIELLKQINYSNKKPFCIVREDAKQAFKTYGLDKILNIHYIFQHRNMTDTYRTKISMCKNMPSSQNVIQTAIFSAIYMGFKKIYLIGVDMTYSFLTYEANDNGEPIISKSYHAYNYSNEAKKIMLTRDKLDNEFMMYDAAKTFTIYKYIKKYSERNDIEIFNCTKGGGLDVFNRIPYESLFSL